MDGGFLTWHDTLADGVAAAVVKPQCFSPKVTLFFIFSWFVWQLYETLGFTKKVHSSERLPQRNSEPLNVCFPSKNTLKIQRNISCIRRIVYRFPEGPCKSLPVLPVAVFVLNFELSDSLSNHSTLNPLTKHCCTGMMCISEFCRLKVTNCNINSALANCISGDSRLAVFFCFVFFFIQFFFYSRQAALAFYRP